jgi:hypothetical protein
MARPEDERLDLSPLDPTRDELRFERMVRSIASRAAAGRAADTGTVIVRWWRVALAVAASLAIAAWAPWLVSGSRSADAAVTQHDPAESLLEWARTGGPSSPTDVLVSLGRHP